MRGIRRIALFVVFSLIIAGTALSQADAKAPETAIYARILEGLLANDSAKAETALLELGKEYPQSELLPKAKALFEKYAKKRDDSGIVSFYLGSLATGWGTAAFIPNALALANPSDPVLIGFLGIGGTGAGLLAAWLMSDGRNFSLAQDIWIESAEGLALANWSLLYEAWAPIDASSPDAYKEKARWGAIGAIATMLGARAAAYSLVIDAKPSLGQAAFAAQTSAWATYYTGLFLAGILELTDPKIQMTSVSLAADMGYIGGAFAWDLLHWSGFRSGLVTIGGLGGILVGVSTNMIVNGTSAANTKLGYTIVLGSALAGQALGVVFTQGMEEESIPNASIAIRASPAFGKGTSLSGFGIHVKLSF